VSEWELRELCPDGACVGVIGPDGTCKMCGKAAPNWGNERARGMTPEPVAPPEDVGPIAPTTEAWTDRALCPDGGCIGVIGDDGKCKVCGSSAA
jgi:hypothetical protein